MSDKAVISGELTGAGPRLPSGNDTETNRWVAWVFAALFVFASGAAFFPELMDRLPFPRSSLAGLFLICAVFVVAFARQKTREASQQFAMAAMENEHPSRTITIRPLSRMTAGRSFP